MHFAGLLFGAQLVLRVSPVPLLLETIEGADGRTRVAATLVGGERVIVAPPIMPYAYTDRPIASPGRPRTLKPLSTLQPETWYYGEWASERRRGFQLKQYRAGGGRVAENARFIEQLVTDAPDFVRGLASSTSRPRVFYLDIEQETDGEAFPKPGAPMIAAGWAIDDGPVTVHVDRTGKTTPDALLQAILDANPDVIVGFYHEAYDLPVTIHQLGPRAALLSRDGSMPEQLEKPEKDGKTRRIVKLGGRVCWDVKPSTEKDMELSGCPDRKLKTIADWLGIPYVAVEGYDMNALTDDDLREYQESDVRVLRTVAARYIGDAMALAEDVGASYDRVMNGGSAYAASIHAARSDAEAGVISDATNEERYDHVIPRETSGPRAGRPRKFQGAVVEIHRRGRHEKPRKGDFASLYPSIIVALGIGSDNVRLVRAWDVPRGDAAALPPLQLAKREGDVRTYRVVDLEMLDFEDKGVGPARVFEFDVIGVSTFAEKIGRMMRERLALKEQAKREKDPAKKKELAARAYIYKVIINSAFGYEGADYASHGSKGVAMLITAGGRAMVGELGRFIGEEYRVETDTDGIYFAGRAVCEHHGKHDCPVVSSAMKLASLKYGMTPEPFTVELEEFDAAYFNDKKQYLLLEAGEMTLHGVAFKGTQHANLFRKTVERVGMAVLLGDPRAEQIARSCRDLSQYPEEDFIKRVRYSGKPKAHVGRQVGESFVRLHGRAPDIGERLLYVKTTEGYEVVSRDAFGRLDQAYYLEAIDSALERLGFGYIRKQRALRRRG